MSQFAQICPKFHLVGSLVRGWPLEFKRAIPPQRGLCMEIIRALKYAIKLRHMREPFTNMGNKTKAFDPIVFHLIYSFKVVYGENCAMRILLKSNNGCIFKGLIFLL